MEDLLHSCAFTGHWTRLPWRDIRKDPRFDMLMSCMRDQLARLTAEGITDFYTGLNGGTDLRTANAILRLRRQNPAVRLHCIIAYRAEREKLDGALEIAYHRILCGADEIKELSRDYYAGCLLDRDRYMVEQAGTLLAVCSGEDQGRTAAAICCARERNRKIIILDPATGKVKSDE